MKAVRLHPSENPSSPYSPANPAPSSRLSLDTVDQVPGRPLKNGELVIKVRATTIVRDALTWPETYEKEYQTPGHDFAGTVIAHGEGQGEYAHLKVNDSVYGMTDAARAGAWAEYACVTAEEAAPMPKGLNWTQAASVPMNALTAYQALFEQAGLPPPDFGVAREELRKLRYSKAASQKGSILITGASGSVGLYLVQLAKLAGLHVVAATSSNERNQTFLEDFGVDEVVEYKDLLMEEHLNRYLAIIDTVGGTVLENCWSLVSESGTIVTIESASFDFPKQHHEKGLSQGKESVKALFFIVSTSRKHLEQITAAFDAEVLQTFVSGVVPLADVQAAYDGGPNMPKGRGKLVMTPWEEGGDV